MRKRRNMGATTLSPSLTLQLSKNPNQCQHGAVVEDIEGVIKVYKDGHVDRPETVPCVGPSWAPELGVTSFDTVIDKFTNVWARFYVPESISHGPTNSKLPLVIYFHGGGFCVGSASWICYHEFLARLAAKSFCLIMSVNYRLAPENPPPAAYEDGVKTLMWLKQQCLGIDTTKDQNNAWWIKRCDISRIFLAGDSAGANIAYNVAARSITSNQALLRPLNLKGYVLIQPFFGGEARTDSERRVVEPPKSILSLAASDAYWRLALPRGANRDHPFCNPTVRTEGLLEHMLVCVAEMDILRDRELEFCEAVERQGKKVERAVYRGVGHAFQVLGKSPVAKARTREMMSDIKNFISQL